MNKKILVLTVLLTIAVTGCTAHVTKEEIDTCETICSTNKGVNNIRTASSKVDKCYCNNGVHIMMSRKVIEENKKVK